MKTIKDGKMRKPIFAGARSVYKGKRLERIIDYWNHFRRKMIGHGTK